MAKTFSIFILLFLRQTFTRVNSQPQYIESCCLSINDGSVASIKERNTFLGGVFTNAFDGFLNRSSDYDEASPELKFYNFTAGVDPDKVYILFQCRGDQYMKYCFKCFYQAKKKILEVCPFYNEAMVWYEECMLRYAYRNIFSLNEMEPYGALLGRDYFSNYSQVGPSLAKTMDDLIAAAATGTNGSHHFGTTETNLTLSEKVFGLAQCTPDIDGPACQSCLETALSGMIGTCCNVSVAKEAMYFLPSCQLRYDNKPFFVKVHIWDSHSPAPSPAPSLPPSRSLLPPRGANNQDTANNNEGSMNPGIISAIASVGFVVLLVGAWLCLRPKRPPENGDIDDFSSLDSLQFDFNEVKAATSNFSEGNKIGKGGFGVVYKGIFSNGKEVAVKRLSKSSQHGREQFKNEVLIVANLQHRNLVRLMGFSMSGKEKLLIYEFLSNSSLDRFLFDPVKRASLGWEQRFRIIAGIARGLMYLHEDSCLKIIHRDLKSSNILLDEGMKAKIADFGLAKLFDLDQSQSDTLTIAGTLGYMAPEYALAGQFSVKSDVYSFGIIILEIVSGQRNGFFHRLSEEGLICRAWRLWNEGAKLELVDSQLGDNFSEEEVNLCILIGLLCIQEEATHRPKMSSVVGALNGQSINLPLPNEPHIFTISPVTDSTPGNEVQQRHSDSSNSSKGGTMSITELCPR